MTQLRFLAVVTHAIALRLSTGDSAIVAGMRLFILLLLMISLPVNAAYTAAAGVCDSVAGHVQSCTIFGHHSYAHAHDHHGHDAPDAEKTASTAVKTAGCDHNHTHAHPLFSVMLPALPGFRLPAAPMAVIALPAAAFVSATPARLERPPRPVPVA